MADKTGFDAKKAKADIMKLVVGTDIGKNRLFVDTLDSYLFQIEMLENFKTAIREHGMQVTKEYVKGRGNIYSNPAIADYNRTRESANKTIATLLKILREFGAENLKGDIEDPLMALINEE